MKRLFKYMLEMKYMSLQQIEKKFFEGKPAHAEVTQLEKDGYFRKKEDGLKFGTAFIPTDKAHTFIESVDPLLPEAMKSVFAPRVNHDMKLTDLRIRFEELKFIQKWTSERMLGNVPWIKELLNDLPDAVCRKMDERGYFLELEISQKTKAQYEYRINRYLEALENAEIKSQKIDGVIFICIEEKVQEFIRGLLPKGEKRISVLSFDRYMKKNESGKTQGLVTVGEKVSTSAPAQATALTHPPTREENQTTLKNWEKTRASVQVKQTPRFKENQYLVRKVSAGFERPAVQIVARGAYDRR